MKTVKRIDAICDAAMLAQKEFFDRSILVADIATDHGYIAEKLSKFDQVSGVIATDISEKSLKKVQNLVKNHALKGIKTVVGDGLDAIVWADIAVIAGIGGHEIIKMLKAQNKAENGKNKCNVFVFQPAQNVIELREYLLSKNTFILKDYVIEDEGRFYPIIVINLEKHEHNKKNIYNLWLGRDNKTDDPDFVKFLLKIEEYLSFLDSVNAKRIRQDKVLKQKNKLKKLVSKLLKNRRRELC